MVNKFSHFFTLTRRDRSADEPTPCGDRGGPRAAQMREAGQAALRARAGTVFGHPQTQHPAVQQLRVALRLRIPTSNVLNRRVHRAVSFSSAPRNPRALLGSPSSRASRESFNGRFHPRTFRAKRKDRQSKRTFLQSNRILYSAVFLPLIPSSRHEA